MQKNNAAAKNELCKSVQKPEEKQAYFKRNDEKYAKTRNIKKNRNISLVEKSKIMYTQTVRIQENSGKFQQRGKFREGRERHAKAY